MTVPPFTAFRFEVVLDLDSRSAGSPARCATRPSPSATASR